MQFIFNLIKNYGVLLSIWLILLIIDTGLLINYVLILYNLLITPLIFVYLKSIFFNRLVLFCLCFYLFLSVYTINLPGYKYLKFFGYDGKDLKTKYWNSLKYLTNKNLEIFIIVIFILYFLFVFLNKVYNENNLLMLIFIVILGIGSLILLKKKWVEGLFSKKLKFILLFILLILLLKLSTIEICSEMLHYNLYFDKIAYKTAVAKIDVYKELPKEDLKDNDSKGDIKNGDTESDYDNNNTKKKMQDDINWVKKREVDSWWVRDVIWWEKIRVMFFFDDDFELSKKNVINEFISSLKQNINIWIYNQIVISYNIIIYCKNQLIDFFNYMLILQDIIKSNNIDLASSVEKYNETKSIVTEIDDSNEIDNMDNIDNTINDFLSEKNDEGGVYVRDAVVGERFFEFSRKNYYKHNFLLHNIYSLDLYMLNHDDFEDKLKIKWIKNIIKISDEANAYNLSIETDESWDDYALYFSKYLDLLKKNNLNWIFEWNFNIKDIYKSTLEYNIELSKERDDSIDYWNSSLSFLLNVEKDDLLKDLNYKLCKENSDIVEFSNGLFLDKNNKCDYFLNREIQDWNDNLIDIFVRKYYGYKVSQEENDLYESEFIGLQKPKLYNRKETELWWLNKKKTNEDATNNTNNTA